MKFSLLQIAKENDCSNQVPTSCNASILYIHVHVVLLVMQFG